MEERQFLSDILPRIQTLCFPLRVEASTMAEGSYVGAKAFIDTNSLADSDLEGVFTHCSSVAGSVSTLHFSSSCISAFLFPPNILIKLVNEYFFSFYFYATSLFFTQPPGILCRC